MLFSNHFWLISEPQMGPQVHPQIAQTPALGHPGLPKDATGRPEASRKHFWSLLEPMFDPFGGSSWLFLGVLVLVVLVVLDCGCGRGGFASGCLRVGCSCGCSRPCFCQATAGHEAPGEERVVGGVGEAIVNKNSVSLLPLVSWFLTISAFVFFAANRFCTQCLRLLRMSASF